jgi:hypothetical protein
MVSEAGPREASSRTPSVAELIGDALMRTLSQDGRVPVVTEMAEAGRVLHGEWLERVFGPLLSANPKRREEQLALLLIATDVFTWK